MTPSGHIIADWPAPAHVRAMFTTRLGGSSFAPWDSLNLGDHVGDDPKRVAANRAGLEQAIGSRPVFLKQVHGTTVAHITDATPNGTLADASVTCEHGLACTIMVADCLPVLLTDFEGTVVAAAHAGWRGMAGPDAVAGFSGVAASAGGTNAGVLEAAVTALQASNRPVDQSTRARAAPEIIAWLGPCIGPLAFEVGADVKAAFEAVQPAADQFFKAGPNGKFLADLPGLAKARLKALGITKIYGNDGSLAWCTVSNPSRFFSHRRDAGAVSSGGNGLHTTGRMAACIWLS